MEATPTQDKKEASKKEKIYLVIIIALLVGNGVLIWQLLTTNEQNTGLVEQNMGLEFEKTSLQSDLNELGLSFDNLQTDNVDLQDQINEQKSRIEEYKAELIAAEGDEKRLRRAIRKLKKETDTLREIMKGYVHTIDSLGRANAALTYELGETQENLTNVTDDRNRISDERDNLTETVRQGSVLQTFSVSSGAIRLRNNGSQTETARASRADMVKTCFGLRKNSIATAGKKDIYIRIIDPGGNIMSNPGAEQTMDIVGGAGTSEYTVKRTVDYNNSEMEVCVYFEMEGEDEIPVGEYIAEVYSDKEKIGSTAFTLK